MRAICVKWSEKLGRVSFLATGVALACYCGSASAQITPDNTMGGENSTVTSIGDVDAIAGGATRGANLFHSFQEFNVEDRRAAVFTNPAGIENILTRVTGANPSNILGTLGVAGNANLFLLNPNGIIFGANARLDVGGSFVGSTASAIGFGEQGVFSATNLNTPGVLTINPNALLFHQIRTAAIQNNSVADAGLNPSVEFTATGLRVPDGNSLLLVGGDINVDGGGLSAFGGRVELGGLAGAGTIGLNGGGDNLSLSFPDGIERSDVFLSNGAPVEVTAGDGGSIAITARNLEMTERSFLFAGIASGLGDDLTQAGNIEIDATEAVNLKNQSSIGNQILPEARGQGGNVNISASSLRLESGSQVSSSTFSTGKGGNLTINADDVQLIGSSALGSSALGSSAEPNSTGDAGDLTINTHTLLVRDGAQVSAGTWGTGRGGNISISADEVQAIGTSADGQAPSGLNSAAQPNSTGDAGNLTIDTNNLLVADGAQVGAGTFGAGKGGSLTVNANDVKLIGTSADGQIYSVLFAAATRDSTGDAGDLTINTNHLLVADEATVGVESSGTGTAGDMRLNALSIRLDNNALLSANTRSPLVDPDSEQATITNQSRD
ncbi:filamentous hemagglutinin N-terminal domain-containing protein [Chroococcidiopsis sp. FACHB-1243]|uniref:two-partner secretion domain-containing protein n=1 Tax=Chroococcidiopsis sp. [FACHB-1243] TaxID=2692781 RepID=UPI00177EC926|nr:filamentous hemagglutinin N-terminal domain-containing protein [Chroococcidiopsis sp. [FACHB-1243]]MBD2309955.1 filamentous hemagglutinin N-terminal domain-containing protein [Chroococcidiopsis sp. [FACHB-1243]]